MIIFSDKIAAYDELTFAANESEDGLAVNVAVCALKGLCLLVILYRPPPLATRLMLFIQVLKNCLIKTLLVLQHFETKEG